MAVVVYNKCDRCGFTSEQRMHRHTFDLWRDGLRATEDFELCDMCENTLIARNTDFINQVGSL